MPIWKKEHWADGADWALGAHDVERSSRAASGRRAQRGRRVDVEWQFLLFVLVASAVGIAIVVVRNRPRTGMRREHRRVPPRTCAAHRARADDTPTGSAAARDEQGAGRSG